MKYLAKKNFLWAILLIAIFLRLWNIGAQDLFGDEAADAFRAVGYLDYLGTSFQTQPVDWYKNQPLPWWTKLSFHDVPPLAILAMNFFFQILGDTILVARLPAVVSGIASVYFLFLIVRKLFQNENFALFSGLFFAIKAVPVWISRISQLEPILMFLILLNIYCFLRFIEDKKKWPFFGITLGLVALTKYTGIFLIPVYLSYWVYKSYWPDKAYRTNWIYLIFSLMLALLVFSPVLVYNFYLYKAVGHFDLQFAYLFGQETPEWTMLAGKMQSPFSDIWKNLLLTPREAETGFILPVGYYGIPAMIFSLAGLIYSIFIFKRNRQSGIVFFWLYVIFADLLLVKIGSAHRFLSLYAPAFAVFAGMAANFLWDFRKDRKSEYAFKFLVAAFFIWEIFHSADVNFIKFPDYGMAKLDNYFEKEFRGARSAVIPESDNLHLNEVIHKFALKKSRISERKFWLIIYNDNVALPTLEWVFYRRFFYHNVPALFVENFIKTANEFGLDYFDGFQIYFVQSTENAVLNPFKKDKIAGLELENLLSRKGIQPAETIYGKNNLPMFKVYKFIISDIL